MAKNNLSRFAGITATVFLASACAVRHQAPTEAPINDKSQAAPVSAPAALPAAPGPPVAAKKPYQVSSPNGSREDDYYWLRDDSRQSPEVLDYLKQENVYRDATMAATRALQQKLYDELVGRLKPDDSSVPVYEHGYWYNTRFVPGLDYPVYVRRKGSLTAPEEVLLDGNRWPKASSTSRSARPKSALTASCSAYTEDDKGRRQYTLKIKNLASGTNLPDLVTNVMPEFVWAADNKTLLYVEKDPVTLLSVRVHKHKLGTAAEQDPLVYEEKDHSYYMGVGKSRSEKYLFIALQSTQQSEWCTQTPMIRHCVSRRYLPREPDLEYHVEHLANDFIIRTNWQAPNFRIIRAPIVASATSATGRMWSRTARTPSCRALKSPRTTLR